MSSPSLNFLKERIEKMSKYHQIEILKLLNGFENVNKNENKNGTFINLTQQTPELITELERYTVYVEEQQKELTIIENEKEQLEKTFFNDNDNDN